MGLLTNRQSAQAFSSYVMIFGFALLVASTIYLRRIDDFLERTKCDQVIQRQNDATFKNIEKNSSSQRTDFEFCRDLGTWRIAAIVGVVIGVIDVCLVPFLCFCLTCTVCAGGLCLCCILNNTEHSALENGGEGANFPANKLGNYDEDDLPWKLPKWVNLLLWLIWVVAPLVGTGFIVIWLYKKDAIRVTQDSLYNGALTVFVSALLNAMVYYQRFMDSLCSCLCGQVNGITSKWEGSRKSGDAEKGQGQGRNSGPETAELNP